MSKEIPAILHALRSADASDFECINLEGLVATLTLQGIADNAPKLEKEWANGANSAAFRNLLLRLIGRLAVFNNVSGQPVHPAFWEAVSKSGNPDDRKIALLACNMSRDAPLWNLLAYAWRADSRGLNRALALEIMGTTNRGDASLRARTLAEYRDAVAGPDLYAKFGALHGSLFFNENAAEEIPRRVIGHERNGRLLATAFAVLLVRNPRRARKIFTAILDYVMSQRPTAHVTGMLLGVCTLCDPISTRALCRRLLAGPPDPRFDALRAGARYVAQHGISDPPILRRRPQTYAFFPVTP